MDLYMAFEKEERQREKKQDALEVEWLALEAKQEAEEAEEAEEAAREAECRDPEAKEAERKEINRVRRSAQVWEGAWAVAEKTKRKKAKRGKESADNSGN